MAASYQIGTIEFALVGDASQLAQTRDIIRTLAAEVNRLSRMTSDGGIAQYKAATAAEKQLTSLQEGFRRTIDKVKELGASEKEVNRLTRSLEKFAVRLSRDPEGMPEHRMNRFLAGFQNRQYALQREAEAHDKVAQAALKAMKDQERIEQNRQMTLFTAEQAGTERRINLQRRHEVEEQKANRRREEESARYLSRWNRAWEAAHREDALRASNNEQKKFNQLLSISESYDRKRNQMEMIHARAQRAGVSSTLLNTDIANLQKFQQAVVSKDATAAIAAQKALATSLRNTHIEMIRLGGGSNLLADGFRQLERASILALGPLSGVGARLAVITALFNSTTAGAAVLIAGLAGVTTGLTLMGIAGVKATMDQQRFDAVLTASTGAANLTKDAYREVSEMANKWGINVRGLVEPYAKFTTSARLVNVSLEDQKKIFEAATVAGRAMHLNNERMGLVFLALEQMFNKGVVSMEELRRQLGDLIPGSFELAAAAAGRNTTEFNKMIKSGEVMSRDLLPKLADKWLQVFGPAAERAAKNLQAELERTRSSVFELFKAFDQATGISEGFKQAVIATRGVLDVLRANIDSVIRAFWALAGAAGAAGILFVLARIPALVTAVAGSFFVLQLRTFGLAAALGTLMGATGLGGLVWLLARIGIVAGGAAAGWIYMQEKIPPVTKEMKEFTKSTEEWLEITEKIGVVQEQVLEREKKVIASELRKAYAKAAAAATELNIQRMLMNVEELRYQQDKKRFDELKTAPRWRGPEPKIDPKRNAAMTAADAAYQEINAQVLKLEGLLQRVMNPNFKVDKGTKDMKDVSDQYKNWLGSLEKDLKRFEELQKEIAATPHGDNAVLKMKATTKALNEMFEYEKMKKKGGLEEPIKLLQRFAQEGDNTSNKVEYLTLLLTRFYLAMATGDRDLQKAVSGLREQATAAEKAAEMYAKLQEEVRAAQEQSLPAAQRAARQQARSLFEFQQNLLKGGFDANDPMFQVEIMKYQDLQKSLQGSADAAKEKQEAMQGLERVLNVVGDKTHRYQEKVEDMKKAVDRAMKSDPSITEERRNQLFKLIDDEALHQMTMNMTVFGKSVKDLFNDLERSVLQTFTDIAFGGKKTWKDLFDSIGRYLFEFGTKVLVLQPMMTSLFGSMYTTNSSTPTGLLQPFLQSMMTGGGGGMGYFWNSLMSGNWGASSSIFSASGSAQVANWGVAEELAMLGASVLGGANGLNFTVGGAGGTDSQFVPMMLTPGEHVEVTPPGGKSKGQGDIIINFNVSTPNVQSFNQSTPQMLADLQRMMAMGRRNL